MQHVAHVLLAAVVRVPVPAAFGDAPTVPTQTDDSFGNDGGRGAFSRSHSCCLHAVAHRARLTFDLCSGRVNPDNGPLHCACRYSTSQCGPTLCAPPSRNSPYATVPQRCVGQ